MNAVSATPTITPAFNCAATTTPNVYCSDPYATPIPTEGPCLSNAVPNGQAWMEICDRSNNGLTKVLWKQSISLASNWPSLVALSPSNQMTSLTSFLYITYSASVIGTWDGTDIYGNQVPNGCYAVHLRCTDSSGNFQELFLPVLVNRPIGRLLVTVRDATAKAVRLLYSYINDPGTATNVSSMNLSTGSFQPSYCGGANTQATIALNNGTNLVWDGRDDKGTILPAGNYTIDLCSSDGTNITHLTSPLATAPLNEASAATTVWASPNPAPAGGVVIVLANSCGQPLTLNLNVYDSGNALVKTALGAAGTSQTALNTSGLPAGTYQIKVSVLDPLGLTGIVTLTLTLT